MTETYNATPLSKEQRAAMGLWLHSMVDKVLATQDFTIDNQADREGNRTVILRWHE